MIEVDGSLGEAGGQILRIAIAASTILQSPVRVVNIRANRPTPGLKAQHLTAIQTIQKLTRARVLGAELGSNLIEFYPEEIRGGDFSVDIGTAGSITLLLQAVLPSLAFAAEPVNLRIRGGTDVAWSPPIDTFCNVFLPHLQELGVRVKLEVIKRGHYPKGGGEVYMQTQPIQSVANIQKTRQGQLVRIQGISHCRGLPSHVAQRQANAAEEIVATLNARAVEITLDVESQQSPSHSPGSGISLWAETTSGVLIGADALGARKKRAETVGKEAAEKMVFEIQREATVDQHTGDGLLLWMGLSKATSQFNVSTLTSHMSTAIKVLNPFFGSRFATKPQGKAVSITCRPVKENM